MWYRFIKSPIALTIGILALFMGGFSEFNSNLKNLELLHHGSPSPRLSQIPQNFPSTLSDYKIDLWRGHWSYLHQDVDADFAVACPRFAYEYDCRVYNRGNLVAQKLHNPKNEILTSANNPFHILSFKVKKGENYNFIIDQKSYRVLQKNIWIGPLTEMQNENKKILWTLILFSGFYLAGLCLNFVLKSFFKVPYWWHYIIYNLFFYLTAMSYIGTQHFLNPTIQEWTSRLVPAFGTIAFFSLCQFWGLNFYWKEKYPFFYRYLKWLYAFSLLLALLKAWKPEILLPRINFQLFAILHLVLWLQCIMANLYQETRAKKFLIAFTPYTLGLTALWFVSFLPFIQTSPSQLLLTMALACVFQFLIFTSSAAEGIFLRKQRKIKKANSQNLFKEALLQNITHEFRTPLVRLLDDNSQLPASLLEFGIDSKQYRLEILYYQRIINLTVFLANEEDSFKNKNNNRCYLPTFAETFVMEFKTLFSSIDFTIDYCFEGTLNFPAEILESILQTAILNRIQFAEAGILHLSFLEKKGRFIFKADLKNSVILETMNAIPREDVLLLSEICNLHQFHYHYSQQESELHWQIDFPQSLSPGFAFRQQNLPLDFSTRLKVLVVDDNLINCKVLTKICQNLGLEFELAHNGREAFTKTTQFHGQLRAILMDIQMPVMDGLTASKKIRNWERHLGKHPLLIIAITAHSASQYYQSCMDAEMDHLLQKPFKKEQLASALRLGVQETAP